MHSLTDTVAVVTGATRGVGRGIATALARQGGRVFVTGRSVANASDFARPITRIPCDHRVDAEVDGGLPAHSPARAIASTSSSTTSGAATSG